LIAACILIDGFRRKFRHVISSTRSLPVTLSFKQAFSESDVLAIVQRRVGDCPAEELERLPEQCRPGTITDSTTLAELAFNLATARIDSTWPQQILVEMDALFSAACRRLAEIQSLSVRPRRPRPGKKTP
jgi:hypothetical protein